LESEQQNPFLQELQHLQLVLVHLGLELPMLPFELAQDLYKPLVQLEPQNPN
jgi:hypothetical protein